MLLYIRLAHDSNIFVYKLLDKLVSKMMVRLGMSGDCG
jgi:hypothetical protein